MNFILRALVFENILSLEFFHVINFYHQRPFCQLFFQINILSHLLRCRRKKSNFYNEASVFILYWLFVYSTHLGRENSFNSTRAFIKMNTRRVRWSIRFDPCFVAHKKYLKVVILERDNKRMYIQLEWKIHKFRHSCTSKVERLYRIMMLDIIKNDLI